MDTGVRAEQSTAAQLRRAVRGAVIAPGDAEYDAARVVYFTAWDRRPRAIVRPADAADVARVVLFARATGSELSVRGGGHSLAGHGVCDGIVIDMSSMRALDIDAAGRVARAGAGLTAGEYTSATAAHGLVTGFGDAPSVGIAGITLAGGVGFLHRKLGMTIDSLLSAEMVTAEGEVLSVDATSHPDLFWAIRGGGGNFGVVTRLDYRLHPVDRVLGGMLIQPATADRIVAALEIAAAATDDLTLILAVAPAPPMPAIPTEHHGQLIMMAHIVHAGPLDAAERAVAPLRALATPLVDMVRPMQYADIYHAAPEAPHPPAIALHTRFADTLSVSAIETVLERLRAAHAPMRVAQFRPLGGAVARVAPAATAFAHRARRFMVNIAAVYERPEQAMEHDVWAARTAAAIDDDARGAYVAFLGRNGDARLHDAYPTGTLSRLAAVKRRYDPENLFRGNHNVMPSFAGP